jgi:hypothetical protein
MAGQFDVTTVISRPIEAVFGFLADGTNDPKFSSRVQEIKQSTQGPPGVGTVYNSVVKDAGMTTKREFEITEFVVPTKIRWAERSKNLVTASEGGYDLETVDAGTKVTLYNVLEGHGFGKLIAPLALSGARKGAGAFGDAIKSAVEGAV